MRYVKTNANALFNNNLKGGSMKQFCLRAAALALISVVGLPAVAAQPGWERVEVPAYFVDKNGVERFPGCSVAPTLVNTELGPVPQPSDSEFAFFVRRGNPKQLAVFFDGGGACWDSSTCVGAPLAGASVYSTTVNETAEALDAGRGIGEAGQPYSPINKYTQVFIPYCTGDLHTGSSDTSYVAQTPFGPLPWTIRHRGADNVAAVMAWLDEYYAARPQKEPKRLFVFGASAGGYGATYHYPALAERFAGARLKRLLIDAANGVINQDFYDRALAEGGAWNVQANLHPVLAAAFAGDPDQLTLNTILSLGTAYPKTRIGQYTTAFDVTQIAFFNIAENLANPALWSDPNAIAVAAQTWAPKAAQDMVIAASLLPNYRHYLANGSSHTIVGSDLFYTEYSAGGICFTDWVTDMLARKPARRGSWVNASCFPNCAP